MPPDSDALLVDLYELTMVDAYRRHDMAARSATFSLFVRSLPDRRGFLVAAGLDDALRWLEDLRFGDEELAALRAATRLDDAFVDWLAGVRFTGTVRAVPEGTIVFANEPILEVDAPIAEAQLAETFLLNQITTQTNLATKAARCRWAAAGRTLIDFGARRAQGTDAAMKLARVSRLVGLGATSNVAGAARYGLATSGTMAHAFVQAFVDEAAAFESFADAYRETTVLLVDTYDTMRGVDRAIAVARRMRAEGVELHGVRLDSGDLLELSRWARRRLDEAGFSNLQIVVSGGLDEYSIDALLRAGAPIDGFGVGSAMAVSDDAPMLESVYKLAVYDGRPVRKTSTGKATLPGAKQVWRRADWSGDVISLADEPAPPGHDRPLLEVVMERGQRTAAGRRDLAAANRHFEREWETLPALLQDLHASPDYPVELSKGLHDLVAELDRHEGGTAG